MVQRVTDENCKGEKIHMLASTNHHTKSNENEHISKEKTKEYEKS